MCGITGFTHANRKTDPTRIRKATYALAHRGPDQQGIYESDSVSLGAVRLKIIDLTGGDQPMHSRDGDATIVFNGEIYNHAELRDELRSLGHRFISRCDTEVVLNAFRQWDIGCFGRLRGMFAVGLWIESERRLVLARDRMGIKPLYIHQRNGNLYFASELKALFEHPEVERHLSTTGLSYYLSLNYVPCPYTLVEGIEKVPPGHWLDWRNGRANIQPYWRLDFQPEARTSLESAKEELDGLLESSVREHMIADVPLGIWASGGLDSSTILHYASRASESLKTFSVSFSGRSFDESVYFREIAELYQTDHHEFDVNADLDIPGTLEELSYYSDEPSADAGAVPVWFLSRMSREHVTVALSGEGADEIFGGYQTYLADRYARWSRLVPGYARRFALNACRYWPVSDDKISLEYKVKRMLAGSLLPPTEAHLFWNGTFSDAQKKKLLIENGHPSMSNLFDRLPPEAREAGNLNRYLWLDQCNYLPDDILYKSDRMSMAHSVEVRPPFLDHRIVEFAARLPEQLKVRGNCLKYVLRELMRDKLPASIIERKKEGFDIPAHDWLRGVLRPILLDTLTEKRVELSGLFHWNEIDTLIRAHLDRRANLGYHLWGLLTLFLWIKRWSIQTSPWAEHGREALATVSVSR